MLLTKVAREAGVRRHTLTNWVMKLENGVVPKKGKPMLLTKTEEDALLSFVVARDAADNPMRDLELVQLASMLLDRRGIKRTAKELVNSHFPIHFRERHSDLIVSKPSRFTDAQRLTGERNFHFNNAFFARIKKWIDEQKANKLRVCRIWNADETCFPTPGARKRRVNGMKNTIALLLCSVLFTRFKSIMVWES